jgi:hypothetical protein
LTALLSLLRTLELREREAGSGDLIGLSVPAEAIERLLAKEPFFEHSPATRAAFHAQSNSQAVVAGHRKTNSHAEAIQKQRTARSREYLTQ